MLKNLKWDKELKVNGVIYENSNEAYARLRDYEGPIQIHLNYNKHERPSINNELKQEGNSMRIYVKQYMTKKSTPIFDFMKKWNKDKPMPMRLMEGKILEETKGMYKMKLRGVYVENAVRCSHCGRRLTNKVSKMYGIGPICGGHFHITHPDTIEEFNKRKDEIKRSLESVEWTGWVIKSAIEQKKVIKETA